MVADAGAVACIDASSAAAAWPLWGLSLVERQLRQLALLGVRRAVVLGGEAVVLRDDFSQLYDIKVSFVSEIEAGQELDTRGAVVFLEGDVVYDERVLDRLLEEGPGSAIVGDEAAALFIAAGRTEGDLPGLGEKLNAAAARLELRVVPLGDLETYVPSLRLTMPAFARRLRQRQQLRALDHLLYRRTFKGVIDAVARYGYYHLVRWMTRRLASTRVTPNFLTVLSILGIWAAIPCFAVGAYGWGALAAWAGVLLDSVDGKLARLRLHLSDAMGALEHASAMPGLGLWFVALGWRLSGGATDWDQIDWGQPALWQAGVLLAAFLVDKVLSGGFKALTGRELFDFRPLDAAFHLVACRRNICLVFITAGAVFGRMPEALATMCGWMLATLGFHALRFVWGLLLWRRGANRRTAAG